MTRQYIDIDGRKWGVLAYYDVRQADLGELADTLENFGCKGEKLRHAISVLSHKNNALTYTDESAKMSVVAIAEATSREQAMNSVAHELHHLVAHICDYYNVSHNGEDAAYLQGYITQKIFRQLR